MKTIKEQLQDEVLLKQIQEEVKSFITELQTYEENIPKIVSNFQILKEELSKKEFMEPLEEAIKLVDNLSLQELFKFETETTQTISTLEQKENLKKFTQEVESLIKRICETFPLDFLKNIFFIKKKISEFTVDTFLEAITETKEFLEKNI